MDQPAPQDIPLQSSSDKETSSRANSDSNEASFTTTSEPDQYSTLIERQQLVDAWRTEGVIHNPTEIILAKGEWHWLEAGDRTRAQALGHKDPIEATFARARGDIGTGVDHATPNVIFEPDRKYLNPDVQPVGKGEWTYLTVKGEGSARNFAWIQLGGQARHGFAEYPYPSARQVWELKQRLLAQGQGVGVLDGIDIAWLSDAYLRGESATPEPETSPPPDPQHIDPEIYDPDPPYLKHDPTNGGEHDQTGSDDVHWWRTKMVNGKKITCDVGNAFINREEPHKFEVPNAKGVWKRWAHADTMDWKDRGKTKALSAWRDQLFERTGWPRKRKEMRAPYTDKQSRWLFAQVAKNGGRPPGLRVLRPLTEEFNKLFGASRRTEGLSSICARLGKMYKDNNGQYVQSLGRGEAKRNEAAKKRKEREESGEPAKRRRTTKKGGKANEASAVAGKPNDQGKMEVDGLADTAAAASVRISSEGRSSDADALGEEDEEMADAH